MITILAVSGKRFAGKDTFAAALPLPRYAFADESKRMFAALDPAIDAARLIADRAYKELHRPALTAFTVDALARDPLVFCRAVVDRIVAAGEPAVISDLRLRQEIEHLRARVTLHVIRVQRADADRATSGWSYTPAVDDHRTETELDDPALWDRIVTNSGSPEDLAAQARAIYGAICNAT